MKKLLILVMLLSPAFAGAVDNLPAVKVNGNLTLQDDSILDTRLTAVEQSTGTLYDDATEQFTQVAIDTTTIASSVNDKVSKTGDTMTDGLTINDLTGGSALTLKNPFDNAHFTLETSSITAVRGEIAVGAIGRLLVSNGGFARGKFSGGNDSYLLGDFSLGTDTPSHKLTVSGGILATSSMTANGGFYGNGSGLTGITASQVGALPIGGGLLTGSLSIRAIGSRLDILENGGSVRGKFGQTAADGAYITMLNGSGSNIVAINEEAASADYINTGNDLGIGTFSPTHKLHVNGGILATSSVTASDFYTSHVSISGEILKSSALSGESANVHYSGVYLRNTSAQDVVRLYGTGDISLIGGINLKNDPVNWNTRANLNGSSDYGALSLYTSGNVLDTLINANTGANAYVKANGGNFGIGNSAPAYTLDVTGKVNASTSFVMGYERISNGGTGTTFTATCSAGKKVTGGGCQTNGTILASYPDSDTTYTCTTSASAATTAWAICGRIE